MIIFIVVKVDDLGYDEDRNIKAFTSQERAIRYARILGDVDKEEQIDHPQSYDIDVVHLISSEEE